MKCLWRLHDRCADRGVWLEWSMGRHRREGRGEGERGGEGRGEAREGRGRGEGRGEGEDEKVSVRMHYKTSNERFMPHLPTTLQLCAFTVTSYQGVSPLHYAVCSGSMDIVRYSVSHGVNVNQQDHEGW